MCEQPPEKRVSVSVYAFESVSTWRQPMPPTASMQRTRVVDDVAARIVSIRDDRLRVIVDGYTASGKTSFGHELAAAVRRLGRSTLRASFDDFKKPWSDARTHGYDRVSAEGYYRNAPDFESARKLLLVPSGPAGDGRVALCAHDPLTGIDHRHRIVEAPVDSVLIVDSVFGMRPQYNDFWDFRIWLDVPAELALIRGIARDERREGADEAERVHRDRYHAAELLYIAEVDPRARADVVIDNSDFASPAMVP
jgi:uridine kinase